MKRILFLTMVALLWMIPATSLAGWVTMFGPNQYVRTTGAPNTFTDTFSAVPGEAKIVVKNGALDGEDRIIDALSSAKIYINGEQIFGPSDFNQHVHLLERSVNLLEVNSIKVRLASKPGSYLSIEITQYIDPPTVTFNADPSAIHIGETSLLTWTSTDADSIAIDQGIGSVDPNGSISMSPSQTTTYTITATNLGGTVTADASVTFLNTPPTAISQNIETQEDSSVSVTLSGSDIDGDPLSYQIVSNPDHGTLEGIAPDLTYTPNPNYNGPDAFTFTAHDGSEDSPSATIQITINPVNDPPEADNQALTIDEDTPVNVTLSGTDIDGDTLTFQVTVVPGSGTLTGTPPDLSYTPNPDFNGTDSFAFTANDGQTESAAATVALSVSPVNDPPVATDDAFSTEQGQPVTTGNVLTNDTDADGDTLSVSGFTPPTNGSLVNHGDGTFTYTPHSGFSGTDSFTYTVNDGNGGTATAMVHIQVTPGSLAVAITSPVEGEQFTTDAITVSGTAGPSGATVLVNGIPATIDGSTYTAENVPLVPGANTLSVLAEHGAQTAVAGVTVIRLADMDLEPIQIEISANAPDDGSLKISGQATLTLSNHGASDVVTPYTITLFEDTNFNGNYEESEDNLLGGARIPEGHGAGQTINATMDFIGELLFRDNRIHLMVDSAGELAEANEENNVIATQAPDIDVSASLLWLDDTDCPESVTLTVRMGNAGTAPIASGVPVSFYDGDPHIDGQLIGTVTSAQALEPGNYEDLNYSWENPPPGQHVLFARVDDDGSGIGTLQESNTANNLVNTEVGPCPMTPTGDGISGSVIDAVTGAYLADATVSLHTAENSAPGTLVDQAVSDDNGNYLFSELAAGEYILTAELPGYLPAQRQAMLVSGEPLTHQNLALSPQLNADEMRIVLTWGEQPADLEAHLTAPNPDGCRDHLYYWNKTIADAHLDRDDRDGYGPETITLTPQTTGTYRFYVHNFSNRFNLPSHALAQSEARVTVYFGSDQDSMVFTPPAKAGTVWHVFDMESDTGAISPVGTMTHQDHPGRIDFPVFTSEPPTQVTYGETYSYQVTAVDPDLENLTYRLIKAPEGMVLDPFSGLILWTPNGEQGGRHDIEIRVNDGRCGEDTQTFSIDVTYLPVVQFSVDPCTGVNPGGDITLTWQTTRADTVIIDQGIGEVTASGSLTLESPAEPTAFTLTASNGSGQVQRKVPQSPMVSFAAEQECISAGDTIFLSWNSQCATDCSIDPGIGSVALSGSLDVTPEIDTAYSLICTNHGGSTIRPAYVSTNCGGNTPTVEITAIDNCDWSPGDPVTLRWSARGVESCEIDPGIGTVLCSGSMVITPSEPTEYTLIAQGPFGEFRDTVSIPKEPVIYMVATPDYINPGESTTLNWATQCADSCNFDQGIGDVAASGSQVVTPAEIPATYQLTATNEAHAVTGSVTVFRNLPAAVFAASPAQIKPGDSATLSWTTNQATACSIAPDIGVVPLNGEIVVQPTHNTTYTLTAEGPGGTTRKTVTVTYVQPIVEIQADPEFLDEGQSATLTWVFSNADTCTIDQGIGDVQLGGSLEINPDQTTTYTITATGPGGSDTDSVTVTCLAPTAALSADPQNILLGESAMLTWNVDHAAFANITPHIGNVASNNSMAVSPTETTTYTLTAGGRGGTAIEQATVNVICPPAITLLTPDGSGDVANSSFAIQWDDADCDDNATIALYYDTDNTGADGTLIAQGLEEDPDGIWGDYSTGDKYIWNTLQIPEGDYYLYAVIDDGTHDPMIAYSDGPMTVDHSRLPLEESKLTAADGGTYDQLGRAIAAGADLVAATSYGSVYVFTHNDGGWSQMAKLPADGETVNDGFGKSVALSGDYLIVGANEDDMGGDWTNPGSAYIYKREDSYWTQQALLTAADPEVTFLGASVDIDGDFAVAGTNGGDYQGMRYPGSAHIFKRDGSTWTEVAQLTAGDARPGSYFGNAVALDGDYLIVGANSSVYGGIYQPAAYIFKREGDTWSEQVKLRPQSNGSDFGISVDIDGDTALVGTLSNVAHVYTRTGDQWHLEAQLVAGDTTTNDRFGASVSLKGDYALIGAGGDDENGTNSGAAYIFKREGGSWIEQGKITASDAAAGDSFGKTVALGNGQVLVAAPRDDDLGTDSGAVYTYDTCTLQVSVDPPTLQPGESATLTWQTRLADTVTIQPATGSIETSGSIQVSPAETTTYVITAAGPFGRAEKTVTLYVGTGPPTVTLNATPELIVSGESSTLTWESVHADTVTIAPDIGSVDPTGSITVSPPASTTYTITATGPEGSITAGVTITVTIPAPTVTLDAAPTSILTGESATLSWSTRHADTVSLDNGIGAVALNGSLLVSPTDTTAYTLTATGAGGTVSALVTVTVTEPPPVPTLSVTADPGTIASGSSATLTWSSTHADSVTIEPGIGIVDTNSSLTVSPTETTTYSLTAAGPGGSTTATVNVTVENPFTLAITSPEDGALIQGDHVLVRGTILNNTGNETGITVNSVLGLVYGGQFAVNQVPLEEGANTITVTATDSAGHHYSREITVNADTSADCLTVTADPQSGISTLETVLAFDAPGTITDISGSYSGTTTEVEFIETTVEHYRARINAPGLYVFTFEATLENQRTLSDTAAVLVEDSIELDALLQDKWAGMKAALTAGDVEGALDYHLEYSQDKYAAVYSALGSDLPNLAQQMQNISPVFYDEARAKYRIRQDHEVEGETVTITYYIYFSKDESGIWKIERY